MNATASATRGEITEKIAALRSQKLEIEVAIKAAIEERRDVSRQGDLVRRDQSEQELAAAATTYARREQDLAHAEDAMRLLEDRLNAGDESVDTDDLVQARATLDRAKCLLAAAEAARAEALRQAGIDRSDSTLSTRVAEIIEDNINELGVADFEIDVRTRPGKEVPASVRQIAVCQQENTQNLGTLEPSGQILVMAYAPSGELPDLAKLNRVLDSNGCTMRVVETAEPEPLDEPDFIRQMFVLRGAVTHPVPHLSGGSSTEFRLWLEDGVECFLDGIENFRDHQGSVLARRGHRGRAEIVRTSVEDSPETRTIVANAEQTLVTDERLDARIVRGRVARSFGRMWGVGDVTYLGRISCIDIQAVERTDVPYYDDLAGDREPAEKVWSGRDRIPLSYHEEAYRVAISITGEYVPIAGGC